MNTEKGWRGGEQQMAYLVEGLRARGHGVRLALQPHGEAAPRLEAAGFDVVRTRMRGEADLFSMLRLRRIVRAYRPDIVHLHTSHAHALGGMAVRWAGAPRPAVIVSRRVDFSIYRRSFLGLNGWKYRHGLDRIVCVSEAIRQVLVNDGLDPATLAVVHSAVDPARVRDARPVDVRARLGLPARAARSCSRWARSSATRGTRTSSRRCPRCGPRCRACASSWRARARCAPTSRRRRARSASPTRSCSRGR